MRRDTDGQTLKGLSTFSVYQYISPNMQGRMVEKVFTFVTYFVFFNAQFLLVGTGHFHVKRLLSNKKKQEGRGRNRTCKPEATRTVVFMMRRVGNFRIKLNVFFKNLQ